MPDPTAALRLRWTLILASVGAFMTSLDVVVVSTALPTLQKHLGARAPAPQSSFRAPSP
jgi:hypothetical protein